MLHTAHTHWLGCCERHARRETARLVRRGIDPPHSAHVRVHNLWVEARCGVARRSLLVEVERALPLGFFYVFFDDCVPCTMLYGSMGGVQHAAYNLLA